MNPSSLGISLMVFYWNVVQSIIFLFSLSHHFKDFVGFHKIAFHIIWFYLWNWKVIRNTLISIRLTQHTNKAQELKWMVNFVREFAWICMKSIHFHCFQCFWIYLVQTYFTLIKTFANYFNSNFCFICWNAVYVLKYTFYGLWNLYCWAILRNKRQAFPFFSQNE